MKFGITKTLICAIGVSLMIPGFSAVAYAGEVAEDMGVFVMAEDEEDRTDGETPEEESYTITYELKGGENNSENPSIYTASMEDITLKAPNKDGYKFIGWYSDENYEDKITSIPQGSTGDKTLYAKWKKEKYTIKYELNGGKNNSKNPTEYTVTTKDIKLQKPTRSGYTFSGWYTDEKFSKDSKVSSIDKGSYGNKVLYARWKAKEYTIIYHTNKGKNNKENPKVYTMKDKVILKAPTRDGYTFCGWYTDKKFKKEITTIKKGSKGNIDVYAKWTASRIKTVKVPEDYISVCDYGAVPNDGKDDTEAFQKTLYFASIFAENGYKSSTVYVPEGVYNIKATDPYSRDEGISVRSNTKLIMDNNAILSVKGSSKKNYAVIKALKADNITIQGGKIQGERYDHKGKGGESGHGISLLGCKNAVVSDMFISSNWGDGVYLGTWNDAATGKLSGNKNIKIRRCVITDNRRNNISLIDADNVTIEKCNISDAHGTAPQCGICIEPNKGATSGDQICSDITIKNTTISAYGNKNAMKYWCFMTTAYGSQSTQPSSWVTANKIKFENCTFNGYVGNYSGNNLTVDKKTKFNGTFDSWRKYKKVK